MGTKFTAFCKNQDQVGSEVKLNYRGTQKFGTILGGCLSLIVFLSLAAFLLYTIIDWHKRPDYNEKGAADYLLGNTP